VIPPDICDAVVDSDARQREKMQGKPMRTSAGAEDCRDGREKDDFHVVPERENDFFSFFLFGHENSFKNYFYKEKESILSVLTRKKVKKYSFLCVYMQIFVTLHYRFSDTALLNKFYARVITARGLASPWTSASQNFAMLFDKNNKLN